ncbi:TVP38/TMEM64 family protein [Fictibacillus fluitans]|uniref:TVP38/TMEM64 family membrane protein n=1 Tax=Fictibacillus fluitans TaxID=3058422 RepID=A0ABT8HSS5_9BACL|nr:VTT domain-containing protein [Fictibacillus sp. NE201]MDN4523322.1 VTT domain-containing protein [Fictibacillus sp. NE201]
MKKIIPVIVIVLLWIILFSGGKKVGFTHLRIEDIKGFIQVYDNWAPYVFVGLFLARLVLFIPGSLCILIGSLLFSPLQAILLSLLGIVLGETIVYLMGRWLSGSFLYITIKKKYPMWCRSLERHRAKFLAFAVVCPFMPTDAACFTAAATGMKYNIFLLSVLTGAVPLVILYSIAGTAVVNSAPMALVALIVALIIITAMVFHWRKLSVKTEGKMT